MPIFDYKCLECETRIDDVFVRRWDDDVLCTACESPMNKLPASPSLRSLDTSEKVNAALKKRSLAHSKKNIDEAREHAKKQLGKAFKKMH